MTMAPGGFFVFACLMALVNKITKGRNKRITEYGCDSCPSAASCGKTSCEGCTSAAGEAEKAAVQEGGEVK